MLDGILMEKAGIPSTTVCTEKFMDQGRMMAKVHGLTDYPIVEMFHPIATATEPELKKEAQRVIDQVVSQLLR